MRDDSPVTGYLRAWSEGDPEALEELIGLVYTELQAISRRLLRGERKDHTLNPTALVHEAYMRLARLKKVSWENRKPFFAFSAHLMRRILVDHARAAKSKGRAGWKERVDLDLVDLPEDQRLVDVLHLEDVLERLQARDPLLAQIIELRFFSGLNEVDTAEVLGLNRTRIQREWRVGRRLLAKLLRGEEP